MAGIYIHIPFCKQKCYYCDFHSSASLKNRDSLVDALLEELELQNDYLQGEKIETIYFGGGTPSLLTYEELDKIFSKIYELHQVDKDAEITLEANPDDLTNEYLLQLKESPVNRLSIGIQSFFDDDLELMNRRHSSLQAIESVKLSKELGFENISIDLIYGLPGMDQKRWQANLDKAFELNVQHLSAYHLTYESRTVFSKYLRDGKIKPIDDEASIEQFKLLRNEAQKYGFIHYEISNFGKEGCFSKHNTNYWKQKKYLGIGPSAHSYNFETRQWNISNNSKYMESLLAKGEVPSEIEQLSLTEKYNDYIMTSLRTIWGVDLDFIKENFGIELLSHCQNCARKYIQNGLLREEKHNFVLSEEGMFIADNIISELFMIK